MIWNDLKSIADKHADYFEYFKYDSYHSYYIISDEPFLLYCSADNEFAKVQILILCETDDADYPLDSAFSRDKYKSGSYITPKELVRRIIEQEGNKKLKEIFLFNL